MNDETKHAVRKKKPPWLLPALRQTRRKADKSRRLSLRKIGKADENGSE